MPDSAQQQIKYKHRLALACVIASRRFRLRWRAASCIRCRSNSRGRSRAYIGRDVAWPDYNPRWRINVRAADGALRRAGPVFQAPQYHYDYWVDYYKAQDAPRHRTNSTYYFNWGRSYALPVPLLNPSSVDKRYRPTAIRSGRYYCIQSEQRCKFL